MPLFGKLKVIFLIFKILFSTQNNFKIKNKFKLSKRYNYTAIINIFSPFENAVQNTFLKKLKLFLLKFNIFYMFWIILIY
jgi:hypothetical protein